MVRTDPIALSLLVYLAACATVPPKERSAVLCPDDWAAAEKAERDGDRAAALCSFERYAGKAGKAGDDLQRQEAERRAQRLRPQVAVLELVPVDGTADRTVEAYLSSAAGSPRSLVWAGELRFYHTGAARPTETLLLFERPQDRDDPYYRYAEIKPLELKLAQTTLLPYRTMETSRERFAAGIGVFYERRFIDGVTARAQLRFTLNLEHRWHVRETRAAIDLVTQLPLLVSPDGASRGGGVALGVRGVIGLPPVRRFTHDIAPVLLIPLLFEHHPQADASAPTKLCVTASCTSYALRPGFLVSYALRPLGLRRRSASQPLELRLEVGVDVGIIDGQLYPPRLIAGAGLLARFPLERHLPELSPPG